MFVPDSTKKKIRILVKFIPGSIIRSDGTPLPRILDGTLADLVLPASGFADKEERQKLEVESLGELLPSGETVLIGLSRGMMKEEPQGLVTAEQLKTGYGYLARISANVRALLTYPYGRQAHRPEFDCDPPARASQ
jgi:hypothetical protein